MFVLKDALLNAIGIRAMTNREALMEELDALPDGAFERAMDNIELSDKLSLMMCEDCKEDHGGQCLEENCERRISDGWLSEPCRHERLIDFSEVLNDKAV